MKNYIKPSAEIVELTVRESLSALTKKSEERTFGFGSQNKSMYLTTYATKNISTVAKVKTEA